MAQVREDVVVTIKSVADIRALAKTRETLDRLGNTGANTQAAMGKVDEQLGALGVSGKQATNVFGRFRAELLSVLFFGMGLDRLFAGLLKPAQELVGIMQIWGTMLSVLFLPAALALIDPLLNIMNFFLGLPEPVQNAINLFAVVAGILAKLLFLFGFLGLGIVGITQAFPAVSAAVQGFIGFISGLGAIVGIVFAAILFIILGFVLAWKDNFANIKQWTQVLFQGIRNIFSGIITSIKGIVKILVGLFSGDQGKVLEGANMLVDGILKTFRGLRESMGAFVVILGISLLKAFISIGKAIGRAFVTAVMASINILIHGLNAIINVINAIASRIGMPSLPNIPSLPSFQLGTDFVPRTGLFKLHEGERVIPSGGNVTNFSPNITVNATSNVDIDVLKNQLSEQMFNEIERRRR